MATKATKNTADTREILIKTGKEYTVHIGDGLLESLGSIAAGVHKVCTAAIITDTNVAPLYLERVEKSLTEAGFRTVHYIFPAGEPSKNINTLSDILEFLAESEVTRSDLVVALGGGVVGDVSGFAAAAYMRGVEYIQVPTSLLAAVDSSVGGKTAIDLAAGKNLAGAFKQPAAVVCDPTVLATLPEEYISDGAAECIKYGILGSEKILEIFANEDFKKNYTDVITESVKMKADYVQNDEFDTGCRMYLNLGHTLGHAIERCSNFGISHGHAVAAGMASICRAGEKLGYTEHGTSEFVEKVLTSCGLPTTFSFTEDEIYASALSDKKRSGENITLIVPIRPGLCADISVDLDGLKEIIKLSK